MLEEKIATQKERQERVPAKFFMAMGGYAPTIGIIGTVVSLTHVLEKPVDAREARPHDRGGLRRHPVGRALVEPPVDADRRPPHATHRTSWSCAARWRWRGSSGSRPAPSRAPLRSGSRQWSRQGQRQGKDKPGNLKAAA